VWRLRPNGQAPLSMIVLEAPHRSLLGSQACVHGGAMIGLQ